MPTRERRDEDTGTTFRERLPFNGNVKQLFVPVTLTASIIVMAVVGGIAWGQQKQAINGHISNYNQYRTEQSRKDASQSMRMNAIDDIRTDQAVIQERLKNLDEKQTQFRDDTNGKLNVIIRQLNNLN